MGTGNLLGRGSFGGGKEFLWIGFTWRLLRHGFRPWDAADYLLLTHLIDYTKPLASPVFNIRLPEPLQNCETTCKLAPLNLSWTHLVMTEQHFALLLANNSDGILRSQIFAGAGLEMEPQKYIPLSMIHWLPTFFWHLCSEFLRVLKPYKEPTIPCHAMVIDFTNNQSCIVQPHHANREVSRLENRTVMNQGLENTTLLVYYVVLISEAQ